MTIYCEACDTLPILWNSQLTNYCGGIEENTAIAYLLFSKHLLSPILLLDAEELARQTFVLFYCIFHLYYAISSILTVKKTTQYLLVLCIDDLFLEIYE